MQEKLNSIPVTDGHQKYKENSKQLAVKMAGGRLGSIRGRLSQIIVGWEHFTERDIMKLDSQMEEEASRKVKIAGLNETREKATEYLKKLQNSSLTLQTKNQGEKTQTYIVKGLINGQEILLEISPDHNGKKEGAVNGQPIPASAAIELFDEYKDVARKRTQMLETALKKYKKGNNGKKESLLLPFKDILGKKYMEGWEHVEDSYDVVFPEVGDSKKFQNIRLEALRLAPQIYEDGIYESELKRSTGAWMNIIKNTMGDTPEEALSFIEDKNEYIGIVAAHKVEGTKWKLDPAYLRREHRDNGKQLPEQLLQSIEERLKVLGATEIDLVVTTDQAATLRLYTGNGYEIKEKITGVKMGDAQKHDEFHMIKILA